MSSGEDSETAEWEREQVRRGTQSRGQKYHQPVAKKNTNAIDITVARGQIHQEIEMAQNSVNDIKKSIGNTQIEILKAEKKAEALRNSIKQQESFNQIFKELGTLNDLDEVTGFLDKHRANISMMPHDQKEMIDLMEKLVKDRQKVMDVDVDIDQ